MTQEMLSAIDVKSLDFLAAVTKQLISLSTGVLAFTVTFLRQITPIGVTTPRLRRSLNLMWMAEGCSIACGLITLLILTGQLGRDDINIYALNVRISCTLQLLAFFFGGFYLWRVGRSLLKSESANGENSDITDSDNVASSDDPANIETSSKGNLSSKSGENNL